MPIAEKVNTKHRYNFVFASRATSVPNLFKYLKESEARTVNIEWPWANTVYPMPVLEINFSAKQKVVFAVYC